MSVKRAVLGIIGAACVAGGGSGCGTADPNAAYFLNTPTTANVYVAPGHREIRKVAVMPFKAATDLIGTAVSDMMVTELLRSGQYELVERSQLANVLGETELAMAGLSAARAAQMGQVIGAEGIIIGTVSEYESVAQRGRTFPVVGVSSRMIDCSSGRVVWSADHADRASSSSVTLTEHGRHVIHEMMAGVYRQLRATR